MGSNKESDHLMAAEKGNVDAQFLLGLLYYLEENNAEAVKWYRKAADQGHQEAKEALREFQL